MAVKGDSGVALKVLDSPTAAEEERAKAMLSLKVPTRVPGAAAVIAWPIDLAFGSDGKYAGFLMPRAPNPAPVNLAVLAQRTERETKLLLNMGWNSLLTIARNYAAAIDALHGFSVVACDINLKNVMVSGDQTVTVIDCDSMQFEAGGKRYLSRYFQREFLAPELHKADLRVTPRTFESDRWALAVLIWMVLMDGHHPFAGIWGGSGEPERDDHAAAGRFPYAKGAGKLRPSRDAPPWRALPGELRRLFEQAFTEGARKPTARPKASEWTAALGAAERRLKLCGGSRQHYFPSTERSCPWCEYEDYLAGSPTPRKTRSKAAASPPRSAPGQPLTIPVNLPPAPPPRPSPTTSNKRTRPGAKLVFAGCLVAALLVLIASLGSDGSGSNGSGSVDGGSSSNGRSGAAAPVRSIRAHYRALDEGRYGHSFALMAPSYRHGNRRWIAQMKEAGSRVNLIRVGRPRIHGNSAWVPIEFYARDMYDTVRSDTRCRRFTGEVHLVKTSEGWRYDPADRLDGQEVSSARCP